MAPMAFASRFFRWLGLVALTCVVGFLGAAPMGCAQSRDPINRVQASALDKHFFVGASLSDTADDPEFYMAHRIIDEPYGVGQGFYMFQSVGNLARIKWEIQETMLVARLTYERVQNSDHHGSRTTNSGQIVAEFVIQSHFDIKRDYNPQTGEQLNLIVENTTDRPWYEREFFRVDWSKNLVTDAYDFDLFALGGINGIQYDPGTYYVQDPTDPNAPVFSFDEGYFDITTKLTAKPQLLDTPYGTYPVCFFFDRGTYPAVTCNPAEATVRLSFKKVVDDDFEPEDWSGTKMNAFGWFTEDRLGYDRDYGILDQTWHRFAAKYNIWKRSHVDGTQCAIDAWRDANGNVQNYRVDAGGSGAGACAGYKTPQGVCFATDPNTGLPIPDPKGQPFTKSAVGLNVHRDLNGEGTEDECEFTVGNPPQVVSPGSRCDEFKNKCDIPLYERETKTTPLYYGPTAPPDLYPATARALNSWNIAVKRAAQLGRQVEADRAGVEVGQASLLTSEADLIADQQTSRAIPDIFVLCHNPVTAGDSPACGAAGLKVRLGDLRYSVVDIIQNPQLPSAWGIETDFDDPLTGEKIQAGINEWAYVLDLRARDVEDLIRWYNGEITNQQIANGQYLQQWVNASKLGAAPYIPAVLSRDEIMSRLNSIDKSIAKLNGLPGAQSGPPSSAAARFAQTQAQRMGFTNAQALPPPIAAQLASKNLAQTLGPSMDAQLEATRQKLLGSQWEAQLLTPNIMQWAGFNPQQPFAGDPTTLAMASPLRGLNPRLKKWGNDIVNNALVFKNMCVLDDLPEPDSLVALARQAKQLYPLPDPNDPQYAAKLFDHDQQVHQWIREQFHTSVIAHEMGHSMGLRHNFTGSYDALNYHTEYWQLRTRNGKETACNDATTPHTNGAECVGPRWIDPVTDQETNGFIWKWASTTVMDYPGDLTQDMNDIGSYDKAAMRFGYADLVDVERTTPVTTARGIGLMQALDGFGGIWGFPIGGLHYSTYNDTYHVLGTCTARPDWNGDPNDPLAQQCSGPDLVYVAQRDMRTVDKYSAQVTAVRPELVANFAVDPQNRVRHPYMFGSDEFADVGNVPVFRFDAGADSYEQTQFLVSTYENRYIFNNFRRNKVLFNTDQVVSQTATRYFDKVQALAKSLALGIELNTTPTSDPTTLPGFLMPLGIGAADGLAMFVRAMTRPEPGTYVVTQGGMPGGPPNSWGGAWQLGDAISPNSAPSEPVNVSLGNGDGRFLHNDYDYTQGYWWAQYQKQVGSFYDKFLAPTYLTEAYNHFISNSEADYIDGRYKNLSYASLYPNQIRRLFSNFMATQSATHVMSNGAGVQIFTLAPYAMPQTTSLTNPNPITSVQYLPWDKYDPNDASTTQLQYPPGAVLLDPLVGWEQQYPALINLFWFGPTSLSMDLIDQMRIFSPGDAASLSLPANQQVRYRDPLTGIEYVAKSYGTEWVNPNVGFPTAKTIGARMLQHANYLAGVAYQVSQPADPATGELTYDVDSQGNPIPKSGGDDAAIILKNYASNIDVVRQLTLFFGYGPLAGSASAPPAPAQH